MHGIYSRQNIRKEKAPAGENITDSMEKSAEPFGEPDRTAKVLMMASFAEMPAMTADAARQSPKPSGANTGAAAFPIAARRLSALSETRCRLPSKERRNHMTTEAVNMTVKAFLTKLMTFVHTEVKTTCISGFLYDARYDARIVQLCCG